MNKVSEFVDSTFGWDDARIEAAIKERQSLLEAIFEQSGTGDDIDLNRVTVIHGSKTEKVAEIRRLNAEVAGLKDRKVVRPPGFHSAQGSGAKDDLPLLASHEPIAPHFAAEGGGRRGANVRLGTLITALVGGPKVQSQLDGVQMQALTGLGTLTGPGGAYLLSGSVAGDFLDSVRPATRVIEAGAQTFPMRAQDAHFPGWDTPLTASWRAEGSAFTAVTPPFRKVNLHAKSVGVEVVLTQEMLEDADTNLPAVEVIVEAEIARAIGQGIDLAALVGSGVGSEPLGILFTPGVVTDSTLGANGAVPVDYDFLLEALGLVSAGNFDPNAVLYSARTTKTLSKLKTGLTSDKTQLKIPEPLASVRRLITNQIANTYEKGSSGAVCSLAFTGQWDQLVIGLRNELSVLFDPFSKSSTGEVKLTVWQRADVALLNKGAFIISDGIKA